MQKSTKEEVKFLQGKLEKNEHSILFARLADAYLQMDRVDDAIELCERGIKKYPYYVTGHYVLGKCYLKKKLFDQAEKELKRVLLFDPKYIAAHRDYGELMAHIGWNNTGEMSYQEIIRIDPCNEKAKQRLSELKAQSSVAQETVAQEKNENELEAVEQSILNEIASSPKEETHKETTKDEFDELLVEPPEQEFETTEAKSSPPPVVQDLFKQTEDIFEDDNVNLDLLEDIFRDDDLPDLSPGEDIENHLEKDPDFKLAEELSESDDNYLLRDNYNIEEQDDFKNKDLEGLDDDEVFALMAGDNDFKQPKNKSLREISEPPNQKVREQREAPQAENIPEENLDQTDLKFGSQMEQTLENVQKATKPKLEPPFEKTTVAKTQRNAKSIRPSNELEAQDTEESQRKKEKIVTSTLGEIYAAQHQYAKAIGVYEILRKKDPANEFYRQKIEYLQKKLEESQAE